ncbi:MAG: YibE/F family protein [Lachnospiraceae bacterium]|nr:YibE/F family protein [Lachnospiraceae bacterium]
MAEIRESMKLGYYFMNLEDKYWGLFLISLAVIFFFLGKKKGFFSGYGMLSYFFLLCPVTVFWMVKYFPALAVYYPIRWLCQIPLFLCIAAVLVFERADKEGNRKKTLGTAVLLFLMLFLSGTPVFMEENRAWDNGFGLEEEYVETYDMLLEDMEKRGMEKAYVWGPKDWMKDCRVYSADFYPIYGKDMWEEQAALGYEASYSDTKKMLYEFYSTYEAVDGPLSNKWQQVEVLADTLNLSSDVACDYVVMHRGTYHWRERGSKVKRLANVDVEGTFLSREYEEVGTTEHYYVFYKRAGE